MEPKFAKGGKLEKWNPVFESFATLAFTPAIVTQKGAHIRDGVDMKRNHDDGDIGDGSMFVIWNLQYRTLGIGCSGGFKRSGILG